MSGFFVPVLRVTTLVASTALLTCNMDQVFIFRAWISPTIPASHGKVAPHWYRSFLDQLLAPLSGYLLVSLVSAAANVYIRTEGDDLARKWYAANFVFAILHMAPAVKAYEQIKLIWDRDGDGKSNLKGMKGWLAVNTVRAWISDIPAFVCALIATGLMVKL
ncbi:uncharacterized protein PAC_08245 [Phialocephala subalpina]|uniref:Integral membrane protein n=1 Tax=Phialocephala subalpina TaxID=576137 RepID=A0A1L7X004_9HELO|nr:uncharacterized protein PAC_08245 [Phialocephala subalpina]